jgi:hypothetical protein
MKSVLLLSGYSGSGKNYVAGILNKKGYVVLSFASILKDIVSVKYNICRDELETQEGKAKMNSLQNKTNRQILIEEASSIKARDPDYFILFVKDIINSSTHDKFVISDMRYRNEYTVLKENLSDTNVVTIRINRDIYNIIDHISEHSLEDFEFDFIIQNDDTLLLQLEKFTSLLK